LEDVSADPTKVPVKTEKGSASMPQILRPFESLRREVDRLFEDFAGGIWRSPFGRSFFDVEPAWRGQSARSIMPAVDVTETDKAYEIVAELPGMDEKNVEVKVTDDILTIKGEKQEEKEERRKDYYLSERSFGSFQRAFQVPAGADTDKIEANFKNGVLMVTLPKSAEAQKAEKRSPSKLCEFDLLMLGPGIALKHDPACLLPRPRRIADVAFRICGSKNVPKVFKARNGSDAI